MTFVSDQPIQDAQLRDSQTAETVPTGNLSFASGVMYRIVSGGVEWIRDPNGNITSLVRTVDANLASILTVTDPLGRKTIVTRNSYSPNCANGCYDTIQYPGFQSDGTLNLRTITVNYAGNFQDQRPCSSGCRQYNPQTLFQLFGDNLAAAPTESFSVNVPTSVAFPGTSAFRFYYDSYIDLTRVELPTGGAIEYDWNGGPNQTTSGASPTAILRRVSERRAYSDAGGQHLGGTLAGWTDYTIASGGAQVSQPTQSPGSDSVQVTPNSTASDTTYDASAGTPGGSGLTPLSVQTHYYYGFFQNVHVSTISTLLPRVWWEGLVDRPRHRPQDSPASGLGLRRSVRGLQRL